MSKLAKIAGQALSTAILLVRRGYLKYQDRASAYPYFKNKLIIWPVAINALILVFDSFYIFLKLRIKEDLIPLHYNIYFGVDLIDNKYQIFKLPLIGLMVIIINCYLGRLIYRREKLAAYILVWASLATMVILVFAGVFILNI